MYVVTVAPLKRTIRKESLTYYAKEAPDLGTLVYVPVRKKEVLALVLHTAPVKSAKSELKASEFQLKKISRVLGPSQFSPSFFTACREIATYFVTAVGATIHALIPQHILDHYHTISEAITAPTGPAPETNLTQERLVLQAPLADRLSFYKTHIREAFAKQQSVCIFLPTATDIEQFSRFLTRGIEQYVYQIDPTSSQKKQRETYIAACNATHPILLLATPSYLFFPRADVATVIIEKESSDAYKHLRTPYLDMRTVAECITAQTKQRLIFADTLLRITTIWRAEKREFSQVYSMNFRTAPEAQYTVIPVGTAKKNTQYEFLSTEVKELLTYITQESQQVFFYTLRKGLATSTVCRDCGTMLTCQRCRHPLVLHEEKNGQRYFSCTNCRTRTTSHVTCDTCGSWNLLPLGIGTDRVCERVHEFAPGLPLFHVSKHVTTTAKQAQKTLHKFHATKPAVLVGTDMALQHLTTSVPYSAVISFDSLLSIPSYTIHEQMIHLLMRLGEVTTEHVLIQTKDEDNKTIQALNQKNLSTFYHTEVKRREELSYPPFVTLIKVSVSGSEADVSEAKTYLAETFSAYQPRVYDGPTGKQHTAHMLLKVPRSDWLIDPLKGTAQVDRTLANLLRTLPTYWRITVMPKQLV